MRARPSVVAFCVGLGFTSAGNAEVTQPNGVEMPLPIEQSDDLACCGNSPETVGLQSLFEWRGENLDWFADAKTGPAVFEPLCSFTGTLVLRGGGCALDFGWYNVDPSRSGPPSDSEIYTLVPRTDAVFDNVFRPLVGDTGTAFSAADIRNNPNYAGGLIGFALRGDPGTDCQQTKFSEAELNQACTDRSVCPTPRPWITAIVYQSTRTPSAFYLAFEDLPNASDAFTVSGRYENDGDFNDFVYFITGLVCEGGGELCETGEPGLCAFGVTECSVGATSSACRPRVKPSAERCDLLDNDCNGLVDDGEGLCPADHVCLDGACVEACGRGEFRCPAGFECQDGFCIDPACVGVRCGEGEACRAGDCVAPCDGVTCPTGQECRFGRCIDPCEELECGPGNVCERGVCVSECGCRACPAGQMCDPASKRCIDEQCSALGCAKGEVCLEGRCIDACETAVCPGGAECVEGRCGEPPASTAVPIAETVTFGPTADGGSGLFGAAGASAGSGTATANDTRRPPDEPGCACRAAGSAGGSRPGKMVSTALLVVLAGLRRRSRRPLSAA